MDPLSDVLSLLEPGRVMSRGFDGGGAWSVQFPFHEGIKCYAVVSGACWLSVEGMSDAIRLATGNCFLLPGGRPFRLSSDPSVTPVDVATVVANVPEGGIITCNGGGDCSMVGASFALASDHAGLLLGVLPAIVHIRDPAQQSSLRWAMEQMMQELREPQPGGDLITQHLAHMMLVQALRIYLREGARDGVGWLFALADKQVGAAIESMHGDPAHRWTLQELAQKVGMSRSTFALRFKETVGSSPMDYLARWRMRLAGDRLVKSGNPVSAIAMSLGYESESAFSTAFKRIMGCSPRHYVAARAPGPRTPSAPTLRPE